MALHLYIIFAAELIAVSLGIGKWRLLSMPYKLIILQVLLAFITEWLGLYIIRVFHTGNTLIFSVYILLEVWLIFIAGALFTSSKKAKYTILFSAIALTLLGLYNIFVSPDKLISQVLLLYYIGITILYVHVAFNNAVFSGKNILQQPLFLICISFILCSAGTVPLFGLVNYLNETDMQLSLMLYNINHIATIFRYSLVALAIYLYIRQAKREIAV